MIKVSCGVKDYPQLCLEKLGLLIGVHGLQAVDGRQLI